MGLEPGPDGKQCSSMRQNKEQSERADGGEPGSSSVEDEILGETEPEGHRVILGLLLLRWWPRLPWDERMSRGVFSSPQMCPP